MINNYSSKVEEVVLEPSTARSLAKKLKSIGYVNQYRNSEKKTGSKVMEMYWIQCLCPQAEEIVNNHLERELKWKRKTSGSKG